MRAPGKADFAGEPVEVGMTPVDGATKAWLVVRNDFDQVVARQAIDPAADFRRMDRPRRPGTAVAHGRYGFSIESYEGETMLGTQAGTVFGTVQEVRIADGQQVLILADGTRVALDEVEAVR